MKLSKALKRKRLAAGLTQEQLAQSLGIQHTVICEYENGKRGANPGRIKAMADVLGCDVESIIEDDS